MPQNAPQAVRPWARLFGAQGQQPERDRSWLGVAGIVLVALLGLSAINGATAPEADAIFLPD